MPVGMDAQARALECTDYCVATMHMQGFSRMFRPPISRRTKRTTRR